MEKKKCLHCGKTFHREGALTWNWKRKKFCNETCERAACNIKKRLLREDARKRRAEYDAKRGNKAEYKKRKENGLNKPFGWTTRHLDQYLRMPLR